MYITATTPTPGIHAPPMHYPCFNPCTNQLACRPRHQSDPHPTYTEQDYMILLLLMSDSDINILSQLFFLPLYTFAQTLAWSASDLTFEIYNTEQPRAADDKVAKSEK